MGDASPHKGLTLTTKADARRQSSRHLEAALTARSPLDKGDAATPPRRDTTGRRVRRRVLQQLADELHLNRHCTNRDALGGFQGGTTDT